MRILIISDVHANLTALDAVLEDAGDFECVWCLGDLVGYGPDPNECIERIRAFPNVHCMKGNHDAAILGEIDIQAFNYEARASLAWLESELSESNKRWLADLEERLIFDEVTLVHGSPRNPVWEYILDLGAARENMHKFDTHICLVGHTHLPGLYQMLDEDPGSTRSYLLSEGEPFTINAKSILNPGSVGQPRDNDPRSAYLIYDDEANLWTFHRIPYDVKQVQKRILAAGLPKRHAFRLEEGW